jgi:hypothetical protein
MKKSLLALLAFGVVFNTAYAQNEPVGIIAAEVAPGKLNALEGVQIQGKIVSVNPQTRKVVISAPNGKQFETTATPEVKNFDKIKVGDLVTMTKVNVVVSEVKVIKDAVREREETQTYSSAAIGDKPSGTIENQIRIVADVVAIDKKNNVVTLKGPYKTVKVAVGPEVVKGIKVGNQIEALLTESITIKVSSPVPAKK